MLFFHGVTRRIARPCRREASPSSGFFLLKVSVKKALEGFAVARLVLCHLVNGVVDSVEVQFPKLFLLFMILIRYEFLI